MVSWIETVTTFARQIEHNTVIIPQNGEGLLQFETVRSIIDGIAVEDLFFLDAKT